MNPNGKHLVANGPGPSRVGRRPAVLRACLVLLVGSTAISMSGALFIPRTTAVSALARRSTAVDSVILYPSAVQRVIPSDFFGINYVAFWEPAEGSQASARALDQTPIRAVRFPGGAPADWYDWQDPYYHNASRTSPLQLWRWARSFGARRVVFQTNYQGHLPNPPSKPYTSNSPQNAAAWVRYDTAHGIPADMEVGNEEDIHLLHTTDDPAYSQYIARFNQQARAMHRASAQVRVLGPVGTNAWYWWKLDGLAMFLRGAGNRRGSGQVDAVSLHYYDGSDWEDSSRAAQYWLSPRGPWAAIQKVMGENDTRRLPVFITEWNLGNRDFHNTFTPTLGHALAVADMIGAFAQSGVAGQDYFTVHRSDGWGLLYGTKDARPVDAPTPSYYALALWRHMGNRVVASRQSVDAAAVMSSYATTSRDGSVQILAINKQPTSRMVRVSLHGQTVAGRRLRIYLLRGTTGSVGDVRAIYDGAVMPSPQGGLPPPKDMGSVHGGTVSYSIPGYSAAVLELGRAPRAKRLR